eukprot:2581418-Prymnesium_polylepis.2
MISSSDRFINADAEAQNGTRLPTTHSGLAGGVKVIGRHVKFELTGLFLLGTHAPINLFSRRKRGVERCASFTDEISRPALAIHRLKLIPIRLRGAARIIL